MLSENRDNIAVMQFHKQCEKYNLSDWTEKRSAEKVTVF